MKAKTPLASRNIVPCQPKSSLKTVKVKESAKQNPKQQNKPVNTLQTIITKTEKKEVKQVPTRKLIRNTSTLNPMVAKQQLFPCQKCGRTFLQQALKRHVKICEKIFIKKRKQFNSVKQRMVSKQQAHILKKKKVENNEPKRQDKTAIPKWKQQSVQFRMAMKKMKGGKLTEEQAILEKKVKQASQSNLINCKYCGRKFNESAAAKHIPTCQKKAKDLKQKSTKTVRR